MPKELICPFLSATGETPCIEDRCALWVVQRRQLPDRTVQDVAACSLALFVPTAERTMVESLRQTATVDKLAETIREAPRAIMSAMLRHQLSGGVVS